MTMTVMTENKLETNQQQEQEVEKWYLEPLLAIKNIPTQSILAAATICKFVNWLVPPLDFLQIGKAQVYSCQKWQLLSAIDQK
jgi:hypothetical protein